MTPGPVKTLSCEVVVYVIPAAKFSPPAKGTFLGLPIQNKAATKEWNGSFITNTGGGPLDASANYYAAHNGYVYLVTVQGQKDMEQVLNSFKFGAPKL